MFTPEIIHERLHRQPFQPFRIVASEGLRFDVHHPDLVMVGQRDLTIGIPAPHHPSIYSRQVRVAIVHIAAIEDLPMSAGTKNGPA
jgi:hypothetical protein